jgi:hypothetical protein
MAYLIFLGYIGTYALTQGWHFWYMYQQDWAFGERISMEREPLPFERVTRRMPSTPCLVLRVDVIQA